MLVLLRSIDIFGWVSLFGAAPCDVQKMTVFRTAEGVSFMASARACSGHDGWSLNCRMTAACTIGNERSRR